MILSAPRDLILGSERLRVRSGADWVLVIEGAADCPGLPSPYLDDALASPEVRERFFELVDTYGLVVAKNLAIDPGSYRPVGGKRTRGRLSQGEFYHHDGCSSDLPPRIVEIRCPPQDVVRSMGTSVARFPDLVDAMVRALPASLGRLGDLRDAHRAACDQPAERRRWEALQGAINRVIRALDAESARAWFHDVDAAAGSYTAPWAMAESRFMANDNPRATVQHRRACHPDTPPGTPNGQLAKRWPAEDLAALGAAPPACEPCMRSERFEGHSPSPAAAAR
jgi:hypothetical protein